MTRLMVIVIWGFSMVFTPLAMAQGQEPGARFEAGGRAYQEGDYAKAIEAYTELIEAGFGGAEVYHNLGNAHVREGHLGEGILAFRRAQLHAPRDTDITDNLAFLRDQVEDSLSLPEEEANLKDLVFWYDALSLTELTILTLILNALAFGGLIIWQLKATRGAIPLAIPLLFGLMLVFLGTTLVKAWDESASPGAVVLYPEITARSGTDVKGVALFTLHEGAEVEAVGDGQNGWTQLRLPDGRRGWVESRFVGLVVRD